MMPFLSLRALFAAQRPLSGPRSRGIRRSTGGNVGLIVALSIPGAATLAFGAIDVSSIMGDRERMRSIAEAAALAGARSLSVAMSETSAVAQARNMAEAVAAEWTDGPTLTVETAIEQLAAGAKGVTVTIHAVRPSLFGDLLPPGGWHYHAAATASSMGMKPLCVLATDDANAKTFVVQDTAQIRAPACLIHSNGNVEVTGGMIEAGQTEAVLVATGNISPDPITDAPTVKDPFAAISIDTSLACTNKGASRVTKISTGSLLLPAGVHCGAIQVSGNAVIMLGAGDHVFKQGSLSLEDQARLQGQDVVLLFDNYSNLKFEDDAVVRLEGRESGPYAGFVIATDRGNRSVFALDSTHIERLDGVIYVPNAQLKISGKSDVARQSDWTVIVASKLMLLGNPQLYLNVNYGASDISAPPGVGPRRDAVRLIE